MQSFDDQGSPLSGPLGELTELTERTEMSVFARDASDIMPAKPPKGCLCHAQKMRCRDNIDIFKSKLYLLK